MATWAEIKAGVNELLLEDGPRIGTEQFIERTLRAGAVNLQKYVPGFAVGHQTLIPAASFAVDGACNVGSLPESCKPVQVFQVDTDESDADSPGKCNRVELDRFPWLKRMGLVCDTICPEGNRGFYAVGPDLRTIYVYPLLDNQNLLVVYDGINFAFDDADETPFQPVDSVIRALAFYVRADLKPAADSEHAEGNNYQMKYRQARRDIITSNQDHF